MRETVWSCVSINRGQVFRRLGRNGGQVSRFGSRVNPLGRYGTRGSERTWGSDESGSVCRRNNVRSTAGSVYGRQVGDARLENSSDGTRAVDTGVVASRWEGIRFDEVRLTGRLEDFVVDIAVGGNGWPETRAGGWRELVGTKRSWRSELVATERRGATVGGAEGCVWGLVWSKGGVWGLVWAKSCRSEAVLVGGWCWLAKESLVAGVCGWSYAERSLKVAGAREGGGLDPAADFGSSVAVLFL